MVNQREVLDSDDEDNLTPLRGSTPVLVLDHEATHHVNDEPGVSRSRRAESTDPSFFQNVYQEHHTAAQGQESGDNFPAQNATNEPGLATSSVDLKTNHQYDTARPSFITDPIAPGSERHDVSHLSSITDPISGNRARRKEEKKKKTMDVGLTQITTPGRPQRSSATTDIWDFPASQDTLPKATDSSSAPTGSTKKKITIKLKATEKKRKSEADFDAQTPTSPESGILPDLSTHYRDAEERFASRKRRRVPELQPGGSSQDVDMLVIPRSEETTQFKTSPTVPNTSSGDIVAGTLKSRATSLIVVPNSLTRSQREEYKFISLSAEEDAPLATACFEDSIGMVEDTYKSNRTATAAYPTSNANSSSLPQLPPPTELQTSSVLKRALAKMRKKPKPVMDHPPSSPDVISEPTWDPSTARKRLSPRLSKAHPVEEDDPYAMPSTISPPPLSAIRRAQKKPPVEDDPQSMPSTISPAPRSTRRRGKDLVVPDATTSPVSVNERLEPPKRGRGRPKRLRSGTIGEDDDLQAAIAASLVEFEQQKNRHGADGSATSPSRGGAGMDREPLADEPSEPPAVEDGVQQPTVQEDTEPKKKRGRKKKEARSQIIADEEEEKENDPLSKPEETPIQMQPPELEVGTPRPKRKRGRPRKSDITVASEPRVAPDISTASEEPEAIPTNHGESSHLLESRVEDPTCKKGTKIVDTDVGHLGEDDDSKTVLSERDNNSGFVGSDVKAATPIVETAEPPAKESMPLKANLTKDAKNSKEERNKTGPSSSQSGRVQYRVGLSRKSRIAPLLKSLRKQ